MKTLWILAAAATFAACHNRSSDETGAAPDRGDSTMVKVDTSSMNKPSTSYDSTSPHKFPAPSAGADTATVQPATPPAAAPATPPSPSSYDTTSTTSPSAGAVTDTTMSPSTPGATSDSASTQK